MADFYSRDRRSLIKHQNQNFLNKTCFFLPYSRGVINAGKNLATVEIAVEKILGLLKANPQITQKEIMNNTGLTRRGVEWNLKKLKDEKKIRRIGPDKGGHWEVVKD